VFSRPTWFSRRFATRGARASTPRARLASGSSRGDSGAARGSCRWCACGVRPAPCTPDLTRPCLQQPVLVQRLSGASIFARSTKQPLRAEPTPGTPSPSSTLGGRPCRAASACGGLLAGELSKSPRSPAGRAPRARVPARRVLPVEPACGADVGRLPRRLARAARGQLIRFGPCREARVELDQLRRCRRSGPATAREPRAQEPAQAIGRGVARHERAVAVRSCLLGRS
jgi:hypothetical protein